MEINLSDIQANNSILSATYYEQKSLGKSPHTLVKGKLLSWESGKSLSADAIYLTTDEWVNVCERLNRVRADAEWLQPKGIKVEIQRAS